MPITVKDLGYVYGKGTPFETAALRGVDFTIEDGAFVGVMGHTGSGKSTLIQLLAGLLEPTDGRVLLDGDDINSEEYERSRLRKKVGVVFQYPECQLFENTVFKDVAFGLKHLGLSREQVRQRIKWALETTGFAYEQIQKQSPMGLSGGEKRRVAIAGVLAVKPEILIMDEPIAGLDPTGRDAFMELVKRLNESGTTIIMISHNSDYIGAFARRILVLDKGRLVMDGGTRQVFQDLKGLASLGLRPSQSREIVELLNARGMDLSPEIITCEELSRAVVGKMKGGGCP